MSKKFDRVLSDDDIEELYLRSDMYGGEIYFSSLVEEIEQAVLAKLAEQEPVAWLVLDGCGVRVTLDANEADHLKNDWKLDIKPLYTHPSPPEPQEPAAWLNEETGDVISSELKDDAPEMLKGYVVPLYKHPDFSCKGKLDSSNHIADKRKMVFDAGETETGSEE